MTECVSLEEKVILKLREKGMHVTCAESCTGGMIAASLVNVAGAGFVTYANSAKHKLLGVEEEALLTYGAVSPQVAQQMAEGAARQTGAEAAIAVTGVAGPDGGTLEKPVGLVYIGCSVNGITQVTENHFKGDRLAIRKQTTEAALELLYSCL